jgi:hypothetical protein
MRLLLFSDLHLDVVHPRLSVADGEAARDEARRTFLAICDLAREHEVDALCGAGNLYDQNSVKHATGEFLRDGFESVDPIPVLLTPGHTDWYHSTSQYATVRWSDNVHVFSEIGFRGKVLAEGGTVWGAAHLDSNQDNLLARVPRHFQWPPPGPHVALFHGCEAADADEEARFGLHSGAVAGRFDREEIAEVGLNHALVGHLGIRDTEHGVTTPAYQRYTYGGRATQGRDSLPRYGGPVLVTVHPDGRVEELWFDIAPSVSTAPPPQQSIVDDWVEPVAEPEPEWVRYLLDGPTPDRLPDPDRITVLAAFVKDVNRSALNEPHRSRVLRVGLARWLAHHHSGPSFDAGEA